LLNIIDTSKEKLYTSPEVPGWSDRRAVEPSRLLDRYILKERKKEMAGALKGGPPTPKKKPKAKAKKAAKKASKK
jgi:hypothetical protein